MDRILQPAVHEYDIEKYALKTDIYKAAEFDNYIIPQQPRDDLRCLYDRFESERASSRQSQNSVLGIISLIPDGIRDIFFLWY